MKCTLCRKPVTDVVPALLSLDDGFTAVKSHVICTFCKNKLSENMEELFQEENLQPTITITFTKLPNPPTEIVAHTNKRLSFQEMAAAIESLPVSKESQPLGFDPDDYPLS